MKKLWDYSLDKKIDSISISENKERILLSLNKKVYSFDFNKNKIWEYKIKKKARVITSSNGFNTIIIPIGPLSYMKSFFYVNDKGALLWKYKSPFGYMILDVDMDAMGEKIIANVYDTVICLNKLGEVVWEKKMGSWKQVSNMQNVSISGNGQFIAAIGQYHVIVFDKDSNEIFRHKINNNVSPYQATFSNNNQYIIVRACIGLGLTKGLVYLLDINGNLLWQYPFNFVPKDVNISTNSKYILVKRVDDIYLLNIKGKLLNKLNIKNCKEIYLSNDGKKLLEYLKIDFIALIYQTI